MLEARDRVGGRTWTADVDGHKYEMGGTWIHWGQPHIYRELKRYNLQSRIVITKDETTQLHTVAVDNNGSLQQFSRETFVSHSN